MRLEILCIARNIFRSPVSRPFLALESSPCVGHPEALNKFKVTRAWVSWKGGGIQSPQCIIEVRWGEWVWKRCSSESRNVSINGASGESWVNWQGGSPVRVRICFEACDWRRWFTAGLDLWGNDVVESTFGSPVALYGAQWRWDPRHGCRRFPIRVLTSLLPQIMSTKPKL